MPPKKPTPKPILLNEEQRAVVEARAGVHRCMASPGSGKSSVLVQRYISLIEEGEDPNSILSLTFTAAAAKNLRDRVESRVGKLSTNRTCGATTFHALGLAFAIQERDAFSFKLAEFPLAGEPASLKISGDAARRYEIDPRNLRSSISLFKRRRIHPAEALRNAESGGKSSEIKTALAYKDYQKRLKDTETLDFDSLILEMVDLLDRKPEVRTRHQYKWCQVDEAQDCCELEWKLIRLLTSQHGNLCAVGDANQNIYSFRGGDATLFVEMEKIFPSVNKFYLGRNYRSSPEIVEFIKGIGTSQELCEKFYTCNPSGPIPVVRGFSSPLDEANFVVGEIKKAHA